MYIHVYFCVCICVCVYIYVNTCTSNNIGLLKFRTWILNQGRRPKPEQRGEMERAEIKRSGWNDTDNAQSMHITWV